MKNKRLGEMLIDLKLITEDDLTEALKLQKGSGKRLGTVLIENGFITEGQLIEMLRMQLGIEFIDLTKVNIDPEVVNVLSKNLAKKHGIIPVRVEKDVLYLAMEDPLNFMAVEATRVATRKKIVPMITTAAGIARAYNILYENEGAVKAMAQMRQEGGFNTNTETQIPDQDLDDVNAAPTVRLVNSIIERALTERASDIHIEPGNEEMNVRIRVDGRLMKILTIPKELQQVVISRLKVIGQMDIAERRVPQDGRAAMKIKGQEVDLRLSTLPTIFGEKVVIRILLKDQSMLTREGIGLNNKNGEKFERLLKNNSGVILIVGPTGSGKSSTMYTMISELKSEAVNLIMLEDPVEYQMEGVTQVQINEKTGMTFASALRSVLRQDPDIIGVGEIRDGETAEIAMRAAMTGHLVISTIHTEDAISALDRLKDMGVEPYLIAGGVRGIISQRLVRRVCGNCRQEEEPTDLQRDLLGISTTDKRIFYKGTGCHMCFDSGYTGRIGVFEILQLNQRIRDCITEERPRSELRQIIAESGFESMMQSGLVLAEKGITSLEELCRTISIVE
ncbi:GspE/PulE family protein [Clostridium sp. Marseille-P299]|uniref:GspE/PulE family protein n=1 Tax=Clostridium sp. Marseille-P299 TaxID=1805477 RepID=UPI0008347B62|nr:GspE/PulE family protein [Clostridium sp. Marseille-P299]